MSRGGFPGGSDGKESLCNVGDPVSILRCEFEQTLGDGEGQRSLVCCSPWGRQGSDTT